MGAVLRNELEPRLDLLETFKLTLLARRATMSHEPLCLPSPEDPGRPENSALPGGVSDSHEPGAKPGSGREPGGQRRRTAGRRGADKRRGYPDEEQCLAAIARLAGLVAMGLLTTSKANSIRASFAEILRWHRAAKGSREQQRLEDADLIGLLRTNPELLAMLEPLLTEDQIEMLTREAAVDEAQADSEA